MWGFIGKDATYDTLFVLVSKALEQVEQFVFVNDDMPHLR